MDKKTPLWQLTEAEGTAIWLEMIWAPDALEHERSPIGRSAFEAPV